MITLSNSLSSTSNKLPDTLILSVDMQGQAHHSLPGNDLVRRISSTLPRALHGHRLTMSPITIKLQVGPIRKVIVLADDLKTHTFSELIRTGLHTAFMGNASSVILLAGMRMGVMMPPDQNVEQSLNQIISGIEIDQRLLDIHLIIPNGEALRLMKDKLSERQPLMAAA